MIIENNISKETGNQALITEEVNNHLQTHNIRFTNPNSIWVDSVSGNVYAGSHFNATMLKENVISNSKLAREAAIQKKKNGILGEEFDHISLFTPRFQPLAEEYFKQMRKTEQYQRMGINPNTIPEIVAVAATTSIGEGALRPDQLSLIERTNIANVLMILGEKDYEAQNIFPSKNVDFIKGTRFKRRGLTAQKGIKLGTPVRVKNVEFEDKTYEITGIGLGVAKHWETDFIPTYVNAFSETINAIPNAMTKAMAEITRDALEGYGGTTVTGARWDSITANGNSTNRPIDDLEAAAEYIQSNGIASRVFLHTRTESVYKHNTWNNGGTPVVVSDKGRARMVRHDGYLFIADSIASDNTAAYVYAENAGQTYRGPKQIFPFENADRRMAGEYIIEYYGSQREEDLLITKITGVDG